MVVATRSKNVGGDKHHAGLKFPPLPMKRKTNHKTRRKTRHQTKPPIQKLDRLIVCFDEASNGIDDVRNYKQLRKVRGWRRMLSTHHVHEFKHGGLTYRTMEHAIAAEMVGIQDKAASLVFSKESGTVLGMCGTGRDARAQQRTLVFTTASNMEKWRHVEHEVVATIARAKFSQCPAASKVLKQTGNAELWTLDGDRQDHLERIRNALVSTHV